MKKTLIILFILFAFMATTLSAWSPEDLTKFPPCMEADDWILNLGVGIHGRIFNYFGNGYWCIPPLRLSFDRNAALGDKGLPFFFGGLVGYELWGYKGNYWNYYYVYHKIPVGFRAGYHFNWGVDKLDTYAVATAGYKISIRTHERYGTEYYSSSLIDDLFLGFSLGARWFVNKGFGFWAEIGTGTYLFNFDIGLSFKF
ncbi:MAG: hypothetical protein FWB95_06165 [Treponema sp.]|nr:hypothetical protein [Treponema sp.]